MYTTLSQNDNLELIISVIIKWSCKLVQNDQGFLRVAIVVHVQ